MIYNWQKSDWPHFQYDVGKVEGKLYEYAINVGKLLGAIQHLSHDEKEKVTLELLVSEALKTSAIEGEFISREDVFSSVRRELGLANQKVLHEDVRARGVSRLMCLVKEDFKTALSNESLYNWHRMLLEHISPDRIQVGQYRTHLEPMQIVSGPKEQTIVMLVGLCIFTRRFSSVVTANALLQNNKKIAGLRMYKAFIM